MLDMQLASKKSILVGLQENQWLVIIAAIHWVWACVGPLGTLAQGVVAVWTLQGLILLAFALVHGVRRYGWDTMLVWGGITFLVSWSVESASIATGSPFGRYHYTPLLGMQIGTVPLVIMPAYFVSGYLAWTMGTIFLGSLGTGIDRKNLFRLPFVASFLMVMWDLCLDPVKSQIERAWIWEDGGAFWGVPISNFFGWYLTAYLVFQLFALYLYRYGRNERFAQSRVYWVLAPVMYLGLALEYLLYPFWKTTNLEIYRPVFVVATLTMVAASVLNVIFVRGLREP
jgi:putative membrane protein